MAARLSQIDYDREMALVAVADARRSGRGRDSTAWRASSPIPTTRAAEFAVMVRSDLKGRGLGFRLMSDLVAYARQRGLKQLFGEVLRENRTHAASSPRTSASLSRKGLGPTSCTSPSISPKQASTRA